MKSITPEIVKVAPKALYIIVSNPCDIMTYAFAKISGLPENQILGSGTALDTARLRCRLSQHYGVSEKNIHAYVFGEHGDTSFVPWSRAFVAGATLDEFDKIVDFWLDLGVDGFRLDAAKEYYSGSVDKNVEVLSWFHSMVKEKKEDAYIVAEVWTDQNTYAKYYESGIDSCFDFSFADSTGTITSVLKNGSASSYGKALVNLQDNLSQYSDSYIDAPFYTNHDMARGAGYYSGDDSEKQTKIAQAMNLLMSGSAFLYYGEELGMKGSGKDENKRAPMYWSEDSADDGMCKGPADMDAIKMKYGALETQEKDGNSIYQFVKQTIKLRNEYPEIARGTVKFEENISDDKVCVIKKTYGDSEILLVYNLAPESADVDLSGVTAGEKSGGDLAVGGVLLTGTEEAVLQDGTLTMPGYSVVIVK